MHIYCISGVTIRAVPILKFWTNSDTDMILQILVFNRFNSNADLDTEYNFIQV